MPSIPLTAEERAELDRALRNPDQFHSDGREVLIACIVIPLLCLPLMAVLYNESKYAREQISAGELSIGTNLLFAAPELVGFFALLLLALGAALYGIRTFRRHGVVITSFGVARVRGTVKSLIRYSELDGVTPGQRRRPSHKIITDELEVKARDGRTIMFYGFGLNRRKDMIEKFLRGPAGSA